MFVGSRLAPALCLAVCAATPSTAWSDEVKIAVVAGKGKGGPNLKRSAKRFLEKPLRSQATVIPFAAYRKAARKARVRGKAITSTASAAKVGAAAGLSHVLVVQGIAVRQQEGTQKKKKFFADVTLVQVDGDETLHSRQYPLRGRKLTVAIGDEILADVTAALKPPEPEPEAEPVAESPPPPPDAPPILPGTQQNQEEMPSAEGAVVELAAAPADPTLAGTEQPPADVPPEDQAPTDEALPPEPSLPTEVATEELPPTEPSRTGRWRPALRFTVGPVSFQRVGRIHAGDEDAPYYAADEGKISTFFPGGGLQLELFPLAFFGDGRWFEGFGLHAEGLYNPKVRTALRERTELDPGQRFTGPVHMLHAGLSFRHVFWDSTGAPDFQLRVGWVNYRFTLQGGAFTGVIINGPYVGGIFTVPLLPILSANLGGHYAIAPAGGGGVKRLGEQTGGWGFRTDVGLRLTLAPFEVSALGRIERYKLSFKGTTNLNATQQYDNVGLTDRIISGWVTLGVVF
jgi:hypothetical protein